MRIKFSFLEKETIGIGVSKIMYETNIKMEDYPAFSVLKQKYEDIILSYFGTTLEEAKSDKAYAMDFIVRKDRQLGVSLPGENYTLVITTSEAIKRMERVFVIQED